MSSAFKTKWKIMTEQEWQIVSTPKYLTCDQHGNPWKVDARINSFLGHLPWWTLDRRLDQDCLVYQVDSNGAIHLLQLMNVYKIQTSLRCYTIMYKHDLRHAELHFYSVPKARLFQIGLMSLKTSFQTPTDPVLS